MLLVQDFLEQSATKSPAKVALICDGQHLTYDEINAASDQLANFMISQKIERGDKIILYLPNSTELVIGAFAALKANAVFVIVDSNVPTARLKFIVEDSDAKLLISTSQKAEMAKNLANKLPSLEITLSITKDLKQIHYCRDHVRNVSVFLDNYLDQPPQRKCIDQDIAFLIYTSGSTNLPKGVMSAHCNIAFAADSIISYLRNTANDIILNVLPMSFDYGLYQLLMCFRFGGTLVLDRGFTYPIQLLKTIETELVTGFPGVPTMFSLLSRVDLAKYDLSSVRYVTNTAAALQPSHIEQIRKSFPSALIYSMYGLTETKRTLYLPPDQIIKRPNSVGIPIPGTEVWLQDDKGNVLGTNEIGELVIRGRHVMSGYWNDPELTAQRYRPGPTPGERICFSGDIFWRDEEGYYYFVSRKDDIIKSAGYKIPPKEIEDVLYAVSGIREAAVVGIPDSTLGEAIKAYVVTDKNLAENTIMQHCKSALQKHMIPHYVEFLDSLPKTPNGKIDKLKLG